MAVSLRIPYLSLPPAPPPTLAWVSQRPLISCYFKSVLSEQSTDALRQPTPRGGAKSKTEPQEQCKQRREREISPSSLRHSGLNLQNQLDIPCILEYLNTQQIIPKLRWWTLEAMICIYTFSFSLFVSVYVYASFWDFVCIALLLPFGLGFCRFCFVFYYSF